MPLSRKKMREYMRARRQREKRELEALRARLEEFEKREEKPLPTVDALVDKVVRLRR